MNLGLFCKSDKKCTKSAIATSIVHSYKHAKKVGKYSIIIKFHSFVLNLNILININLKYIIHEYIFKEEYYLPSCFGD